VCLQMARVSLQPRVCLKVGVCVVPLEKREEVVRLAPEVCAGPVVSRPGRWELSSELIACLPPAGRSPPFPDDQLLPPKPGPKYRCHPRSPAAMGRDARSALNPRSS
jgi:hypothetical protein